MIKTKTLSLLLIVMTWVVFSALPAGLSAENEVEEKINPVADVKVTSTGIWFSPKVSYAQLVLTVSTPYGEVISKTFDDGSTPYFELSGDYGEGPFSYELRVIPRLKKDTRDNDEMAGLGRDKSYLDGPLVQSGAFYVERGSIIMEAGATEEGIAKPLDFNINDDLIVQGSACIGFDCVNGESFGFDTIRLKENNLRIKFDDTSTIAGFPNGDWQITINDSNSGGASKFSIEDITDGRVPFTIEGNAPTNSLYVDDGGRLGIRTATPSLEIHVVDGDTPALRLQQSSASGFAPQTWDIAGNETNFFIRDVTSGSRLPFRIRPGAPTNSIDIAASGNVGMGTSSPGASLDIKRTGANASILFQRTDGATGKFTARPDEVYIGSGSAHNVKIVANNNVIMTAEPGGNVGIGVTGPTHKLDIVGGAYCNGTTWQNASSRELKENIKNLQTADAIDALNQLNPVRFNYKTDLSEEFVGFIAEDVPELVATKGRKGLSPMDIVAVLTKVVQEQQKTITELKAEIKDIKNQKK
jgi:hypothetical protein